MKAAPETGPNRSGTRYSAADKLKAVKLYLEEGYQVKAIARELGIGKSSLGKWIREYREKVLALSRLRRRKVLRKRKIRSGPGVCPSANSRTQSRTSESWRQTDHSDLPPLSRSAGKNS